MLVLTRKVDETIHIGDEIEVTVNRIQGDRIRLAIKAPRDVNVARGELLSREDLQEVNINAEKRNGCAHGAAHSTGAERNQG